MKKYGRFAYCLKRESRQIHCFDCHVVHSDGELVIAEYHDLVEGDKATKTFKIKDLWWWEFRVGVPQW